MILWTLLFFIPSFGFSETLVDRRAWIWEQWATPTPESGLPPFRLAVQAVGGHLEDSYVSSLRVFSDLDLIEVALRGGVIGSLGLTAQGVYEASLLSQETWVSGVEIARRYVFRKEASGRLGLEWLQAYPSQKQWLRLTVQMQILEQPQLPWQFTFALQILSPLVRSENAVSARISIQRTLSPAFLGGKWRYGMITAFTQRLRTLGPLQDPTQPERYESMLFSVGPSFEYETRVGSFEFFVPARLHVDQELFQVSNVNGTRYIPDLTVSGILSWKKEI